LNELAEIKNTFQQNLKSVTKLVNFDRDVQDFTIQHLEKLQELLKKRQLDNPRMNVERTLQMLRSIRGNDSLRSRYETIFNQAVVLLVSYFGSAVGDVFRCAIAKELAAGANTRLSKEELRVTLQEIVRAARDVTDSVPDLFILKKDISFQDMQSISRAFEDYVDISLERDQNVNNIIVGQACRNVIVHKGAVIDERLIRQISGAKPRTLKQQLQPGKKVEFTPEEIQVLSESMSLYVDRLCAAAEA
jgi:hypothetical protein